MSPAEEKDFTDREKAMKWATRRAEDPSRIGKPDEPETKWDTDADGREILTVTGIEGSEDDNNPAALITDVPGVGTLGAVYNKKSGIGGTPFEVRTFRSREEAKDWANNLIGVELDKFKNGEDSDLFKRNSDSDGMPEPITRDFLSKYLDDPNLVPAEPNNSEARQALENQALYDPEKTTGTPLWIDETRLADDLRIESNSQTFSSLGLDASELNRFREEWRNKKFGQITTFIRLHNRRVEVLLEVRRKSHVDGVFDSDLHKKKMAQFTFAQNRTRDRIQRARVASNIKLVNLLKMINPDPAERRLKNQFETRVTGGHDAHAIDPKWGMKRRSAEWQFANVPLETPDNIRTKYGFPLNEGVNGIGDVTDFEGPEDVIGYREVSGDVRRTVDSRLDSGMRANSASGYGEITLVMKDSVKNRTTMTFEDSLGLGAIATPMLNFTDEQMWNAGWGDSMIDSGGGVRADSGYFEIQMNGRIGLEEVEAFYAPTEALRKRVEDALRRIGVGTPVMIKTGR